MVCTFPGKWADNWPLRVTVHVGLGSIEPGSILRPLCSDAIVRAHSSTPRPRCLPTTVLVRPRAGSLLRSGPISPRRCCRGGQHNATSCVKADTVAADGDATGIHATA